MIYWYVIDVLLIVMLLMMSRLFFSKRPRLRVLMYHKVAANGQSDFLTVTATHLEAQFHYLTKEGYSPILLSELVNHVQTGAPLPANPVLITFDDGYRDNYTVLYPLLKAFGMKANIFLVPAFLQNGQSEPGIKPNEYLRLADIRAMDQQLVEYGLHSYDHKSYKVLSPEALANDLAQTKEALQQLSIPFQPCLAFPYGAYPKRNPGRQRFFQTLAANNIVLAFRIGNRLNALPLRNPLLIQRLDIRGDEPFSKFVRQLQKGKHLFS